MTKVTIEIMTNQEAKEFEVDKDFKTQVEQLRDDLILYYKNNENFNITELNQFEIDYTSNYAPENEKINELAYDKIIQILNGNIYKTIPYTYVDEHEEFGDAEDEVELEIAKKLDERYYQFKAVIEDIVENNFRTDKWQKLINNDSNLSRDEANAIAATIMFDKMFYDLSAFYN